MTVIGIGQCCWDTLAVVAAYPEADDKEEILALDERGGGPAATALVALARLGVACRFYGVVGDDSAGVNIRRSLAAEGIETSGIAVRPGTSSQTAFIVVEKEGGRRTIFWRRPAGVPLLPSELPPHAFDDCRFLLLDGLMEDASLHAARQARVRGIPVLVDAGRMRPGMLELARECDYLVTAERFARDCGWDGTPETLPALVTSLGPPVVTITRGNRGSITWADGSLMTIPAFAVAAQDTTGAGDVFHGGYLYGILKGWGVRETVVFASAMAALTCTRAGGRGRIPHLREVEQFLAEHEGA